MKLGFKIKDTKAMFSKFQYVSGAQIFQTFLPQMGDMKKARYWGPTM